MVVLGTLLRAGGQVRVSAQVVDASSGTVVCSCTAQGSLADIFNLQDDLTRQVVDALAIPLSVRDRQVLRHDVPASAEAYELYLRANHLGEGASSHPRLVAARDYYRRCLELDPEYAPAWARLARVHRVLAKYGYGDVQEERRRAEEAFRRALAINSDLPLAHNLYTYFELEELGPGGGDAMLRLLGRVRTHTGDPDLFAGLVVV